VNDFMTNRLAKENSPYLLQHSENPVDWYPWGAEALDKAMEEDKPIFLSIGYAACHWCHVMAHESFEDPNIAAFMNENFVNIKVDREERPDIDSIYMNAVVAMTGHGGWPMSVFLTPQGQPFYGGTYFPPSRRYNMPSFVEILEVVNRLWKNDRAQLLKSSSEISDHIRQNQQIELHREGRLATETLDQSSLRLAQSYDWKNGGWGAAPKFPQPMAIDYLLRRGNDGDSLALDVAQHALTAMARGGMYDVIGGGFARYSTDDDWLVPHFEKMLYDNALLSRSYLYAYLVTRNVEYLNVCKETLQFIQREMMSEEGGFYSSLDADSEGEEGKYYTWEYEEIISVLESQPDHGELFLSAFVIERSGNFEGRIILQRDKNDAEIASLFDIPLEAVQSQLISAKEALFHERVLRIRPSTDDKILTSWNAFALLTFAEAARYLDESEYLFIAQKNARFLVDELLTNGNLFRSWRKGNARHAAYLEDYAGLILGLLALYQTDFNNHWFIVANSLTEKLNDIFTDESGGFFDSSDASLLFRPKDVQDNAIPCGNSLAAMSLLQMAALSGREDWRQKAEGMLASIQASATRYPTAFANWLTAMHFALGDVKQIGVLSPSGDTNESKRFSDIIWKQYRPDVVLAGSNFPIPDGAPELLRDRPLVQGITTAYLCSNFVCQQPVISPKDLEKQLIDQSR
jgi:uncharacterized protein YyaL (SSP411 family)